MANGTIAFDTLTTSDSKNTNTEKSIDTSFIFNGVSKAWSSFTQVGTTALTDSFNISSLTDDGTGQTDHALTTSMINSTYGVYQGGFDSTYFGMFSSFQVDSSNYRIGFGRDGNAYEDADEVYSHIQGDLA